MRDIFAGYLLLVSIWMYSEPESVGRWAAKITAAYLKAMAGG